MARGGELYAKPHPVRKLILSLYYKHSLFFVV